MTWAIYMLCLKPEIQTRLRKEIRENLPSMMESAPDANITNTDIDNLPYLNAVCNEVLRYYAPVPMTMREASVDTTILGQKIPKGTTIMLVPAATNKDKAYWGEDAQEFDPERWLSSESATGVNNNGGAKSNYNFMTFLHGPRSCIGQSFAKAEFAVLLAAWIGRFEFELNNKEEMDESKMEIKGAVTARPANGLWVRAKVLDGW
jgi:cytochrome P450